MLKSYFDESSDGSQQKIFVVGAMMGRYEEWRKIECPWKQLLDDYEIEYYRASEAEFARGQFEKEPYRTEGIPTTARQFELLHEAQEQFFQIICKGVVSGAVLGIPMKDFQSVANTPEKLDRFGGTPYLICAHTVMIRMLKAAKYELDSRELMAFIFDRQEQFESEMLRVHRELTLASCEFHSQVGSISFDDKRRFIPLQVADTLAYEARKDLQRKIDNPNASERIEFTRLKESGKIFEIGLFEQRHLQEYLDNSNLPVQGLARTRGLEI